MSAQGQVKLPTKLAKALRVGPGDEFFWRHSDDDPDVLLLIPVEVVERRYSGGADAEARSRENAEPLPEDLKADVDISRLA